MANYRVRPSKPVAVMGAVFGLAIMMFGIFGVGHKAGGFLFLWIAVCLAIIAFNLWAAFARNGSVQTISSSDDGPPPPMFGQRVDRD